MGFWIMIFAALAGIVLLVTGIVQSKKDRRWWAAAVVGVVFLGVAIWLALPH